MKKRLVLKPTANPGAQKEFTQSTILLEDNVTFGLMSKYTQGTSNTPRKHTINKGRGGG